MEYREGILLLDSGCRSDAERIRQFVVGVLKRPMSHVKLAAISHIHPDHAGGGPKLSRDHKIPLAAPSRINRWYAGTGGFIQHKIDTALAFHVSRATGKRLENICSPRTLSLSHPLKEGEKLPFFGDWEVMDLPGHTSHDMGLYNRREEILYAGDAMLLLKDKLTLPFPVSFPELMEESLTKLTKLPVKTLLLPHGGTVRADHFPDLVGSLLENLYANPHPMLKMLKPLSGFTPEIRNHRKLK